MKKKNDMKKYAVGLGAGAVGLSVGSQVLGDIGGGIASKGQLGMQKAAGFFPALGTIAGAGLTMGALNTLKKQTKKFKKRK